MPTTLINPHKYKKFPYSTTKGRRRIEIQVEANRAIDVFIVQDRDLQDWRESRDYGGISFMSTKAVEAEINIPKGFDSDWFLILENHGDEPAAVHYELFDL